MLLSKPSAQDFVHIIGDGPHAREVASLVKLCLGDAFKTRPVDRGNEASIPPGSLVVLALGNARHRLAAYMRLSSRQQFVGLRSPHSIVDPSVHIGVGCVVSHYSVISHNAVIEDATLVNWSVTVGHDAIVEHGCVINPKASISGGARIGPGTLIGAGAVVLESVTVGANAIVGAGAVVTRSVPTGTVVVGVPAKPLH